MQYADGYIFFVRQTTLMAQKFDPDNFKLSGDAQTIAGNVRYNDGLVGASFSVSNSGNIFLQNDNIANINLELYNLKTRRSEFLLERKLFLADGLFSPDDKKCVFTSPDLDGKNSNIWTYDFARKNTTRITFQNKRDGTPIWSSHGKYLAFSSFHQGYYDIFMKNSDGTGDDSLLYHSEYSKTPNDWSMDGNELLFTEYGPNFNTISLLQLNDKNKARNYSSSEFFQRGLKYSKDKKWILYGSTESGKYQLYLRAYDGSGTKWQVTNDGGRFVGWINNDKELIIRKNSKLYTIKITLTPGNVIIGSTEFLADLPDNALQAFDISNDSENILINTSGSASISLPFTYIQNWKGLISEKDN